MQIPMVRRSNANYAYTWKHQDTQTLFVISTAAHRFLLLLYQERVAWANYTF